VDQAGTMIRNWQNRFNQEIITVARMDNVPGALMKNIFMKESQLWPGIYAEAEEVGFGHLTLYGADTTLLWNPRFFNDFCPLVLDRTTCNKGFARMGSYAQNLLKGALLTRINASCAGCENGIDLTKADFSIHIFAESLKANCSQVNQIIYNNTRKAARQVSSYEDLWRFTLVNYNAGPGCLSYAIYQTNVAKEPIDWAHVAAHLTPVCRPAVQYVVDVTGGDTELITVFATPVPTGTPTKPGTVTPTIAITPSPTSIQN
jgi:hypothetical protein